MYGNASSSQHLLMIVVVFEGFEDAWLCGDHVVVLEVIEQKLYK